MCCWRRRSAYTLPPRFSKGLGECASSSRGGILGTVVPCWTAGQHVERTILCPGMIHKNSGLKHQSFVASSRPASICTMTIVVFTDVTACWACHYNLMTKVSKHDFPMALCILFAVSNHFLYYSRAIWTNITVIVEESSFRKLSIPSHPTSW